MITLTCSYMYCGPIFYEGLVDGYTHIDMNVFVLLPGNPRPVPGD